MFSCCGNKKKLEEESKSNLKGDNLSISSKSSVSSKSSSSSSDKSSSNLLKIKTKFNH